MGGIAALLDFIIYIALLSLNAPSPIAKMASFIMAAIAAYFAHHHITFRRTSSRHVVSMPLFCLLYGTAFAINVGANELFLSWGSEPGRAQVGIAWAGATFLSSFINFVGGKFLVFRDTR